MANGVASAIDRFVETPEEKKAAELLKMKAQREPAKWQAEISKAQVAHRSLFVAGARPFIMWVCGAGFLFSFVINPIIQWISGDPGPQMPIDIMMELTIAMLGLSGLRTFEKLTDRAK
jgi:hypothetical protein